MTNDYFKPGDRIGAVVSVEGNEVWFIGFGVYAGREVPPMGSNGTLQRLLHIKGESNPKLVLDSGEVVWGFECWWGDEATMKEFVEAPGMIIKQIKREGDNWVVAEEAVHNGDN